MEPYLEQPLRSVMFATEGSDEGALLDRTEYTQPALFALEVALYRQWCAWGLTTTAVAGHSIGELSAAHVAGVIGLADAARLVCARGRLMQACQAGGSMVSLEATEDEVRAAIANVREGEVDIAGLNGPRQTVISGDALAVLALSEDFARQGRRTRRLNVSHAFHSPHMDSMLAEYEAIAGRCCFESPRVPVVSLLTGKAIGADELASPRYWSRQVREAVRFSQGVEQLSHLTDVLLECGPDAVLSAMGPACLPEGSQLSFVPSQRKGQGEARALATALAALHVHGAVLSFSEVLPGKGNVVELPTYAFQHQHYWLESTAAVAAAQTPAAEDERDLWQAIANVEEDRVADLLSLPAELRASASSMIPYLSAWRERKRASAEISRWLYDEAWRTHTDGDTRPAALTGTWALVGSEHSLETADLLSATLSAAGAQVVRVLAEGDRAACAATLLKLEQNGLAGVLLLNVLAVPVRGEVDQLPHGLGEALTWLQSASELTGKTRIWIVTRGAVSVTTHELLESPVQTAIWGLGRAFSLEQPERWGGLLDLPPERDENTQQAVLRTLANSEGEDQVAIRRGVRWVRRLERVAGAAPARAWRTGARRWSRVVVVHWLLILRSGSPSTVPSRSCSRRGAVTPSRALTRCARP